MSYLYMAAAFVVVVAGIRAAEAIINPLLLAVFLAIISAPAYFGLVRRGVSTWASLLIVIAVLSFGFLGVVLVVMDSIAGFTSRQAHYADRITEETQKVQNRIEGMLPDWLIGNADATDPGGDPAAGVLEIDDAEPPVPVPDDSGADADALSNSETVTDHPVAEPISADRLSANDDRGPPGAATGTTDESNDAVPGFNGQPADDAPADDAPASVAQDETGEIGSVERSDDADSVETEAWGRADAEPVDGEREFAAAPILFTGSDEPLPQSERSWQEYMMEQFKPRTIFTLAAGIVGSIGQILSKAFLILLTVIFILLEAGTLDRKVKDAFARQTPDAGQRAREIIDSIHRYIVIKSWVSLLTGLLIAMWLKLLGVPYANLWGLLAFMFNFVPNVGSVIAAIPAVLIAWLDLSAWPAISCAMGFVVVNVVLGNLIEPRVMGRGLGLSPLVVFCSMVFWGWVLGPVGMLLSVPLTMTARIALDGFEDTKWVATLMGNVSQDTVSRIGRLRG